MKIMNKCKQCDKELESAPTHYRRVFCKTQCSLDFHKERKRLKYQESVKALKASNMITLRERWRKWPPESRFFQQVLCSSNLDGIFGEGGKP